MSFSQTVKDEIIRLELSRFEEISELSAIIKNSSQINNGIIISLENNILARKVYNTIKKLYDIRPTITVRQRYNFNTSRSYILTIKNKQIELLNDTGVFHDGKILSIPKSYIYDDEELSRSYIRGVFLTTGSINDPKTSRYHMQMLVKDIEYAYFVKKLISKFGIEVKVISCDKNYMIYLKEAEKISDFLRIIKAYNAVLYFEDIRIYRDHKNMTNRLNNCEQANMDKIFLCSMNQIKTIEKLKAYNLYDTLDEKLKLVINYRLKYPESSLEELSEIICENETVAITKSGLNHRLRRLKEILENYEKNS